MQKKNEFKIIRVPVPSPTLYPHTNTNCYLIGNEHEAILVDAGYNQPETRIVLEKTISDHNLAVPKSIILTHAHPDHAPGVLQLQDWSPTVYCHPAEKETTLAAISPWNNLSFLNDGDTFKVGDGEIQIIHAPGHTSGHLNLYIPTEQILLAGDNIVAEGTSWIGPPDGDMIDYLNTLNRLMGLKIKKIGPGHGGWVLKPYQHIEFVLNRRLEREKQIKELLHEHEQLTSISLTKLIYDRYIHPSIFEVARRTTEAHLIKLIKEGSVSLQGTLYSIQG
nr:MBL fold metallo-hydrolase [Neobacillus sp. Marseille-Q6967]